MTSRALLLEAFGAGVAACAPEVVLPPYLPTTPARGRTLVLGAGKAAAAMAAVAAARVTGRVEGCVVTRHGHGVPGGTGAVEVIEAGHPTPDAASLEAGRRIRALAQSAGPDDRVLFMISGGGSALMADPVEGLAFEEKRAITRHLVESGAPVAEINAVRAQLSRLKGGGLARLAHRAELASFVISDVVGDDPAVVASGPTLGQAPGAPAAEALLRRWGWSPSDALITVLRRRRAEAPPTHPMHLLATNATALQAAEAVLSAAGWPVVVLPELTGEAGAVGVAHAALALHQIEVGRRMAIVSGGELTVTVDVAGGRGGPNLEYLAALMAALPPGAPVEALACDTDGIDGTEDAAGATFDRRDPVLARLDPAAHLAAHRSYDLFDASGGLVVTGPTRTNVNDLRIVLAG